jgi:hypothetical protein
MKCRTIHKKLIFFIEGELPQQEMHEVALHLDECSGCAAFAEDMRKTLGIVELEKNIQVTPYFYSRLKSRMEKKQEPEVMHVGFPLWEKVLQPAMFLILLLTGIYTGMKIGEQAGSESQETGYAVTEIIPFLNEMEAEPLENFLME